MWQNSIKFKKKCISLTYFSEIFFYRGQANLLLLNLTNEHRFTYTIVTHFV